MNPFSPVSGPYAPYAAEPALPEAEPEDGSAARSLAQLAERALRCTPGCCGATATATDTAGPLEEPAVTHPDLAVLVAVQEESGDGPIPEALATGEPVGSDDLLRDDRWPRYRAAALDLGVRFSATLPYRRDDLDLTLSVYGLRPRSLAAVVGGATALLGDLSAAGLVRDRRYRETLAQVEQLDTALRSRPVIDQACGIVMYLRGCDAKEAFDLLRRMSQHSNRKVAELARAVVRHRGRGLEEQLRRLDAVTRRSGG